MSIFAINLTCINEVNFKFHYKHRQVAKFTDNLSVLPGFNFLKFPSKQNGKIIFFLNEMQEENCLDGFLDKRHSDTLG